MEIFKKKSLILKIVIALVVVILFNFSAPTISQADAGDVVGGILLEPVTDLLLSLGDGIVFIMQSVLFGMDESLVRVATPGTGIWETVGTIVGGILGIGAVVAITIVTGGAALAAIIPSVVVGGGGAYVGHQIAEHVLPDSFYLPIYAISPEEIFQNKIGLLDVNFFNPNPYEDIITEDGQVIEQESTASKLQATISSWYLTLRNFAIVVLLIVLLYIGIKIVASSASQERAKYKEKLFSWIVALCLLFFMHYIMSFATTIVEAISEGINTINKPIIITLPEEFEEKNYQVEVVGEDGERGGVPAREYFEEVGLISDSGVYTWPTNLMGIVRLELQMDNNVTEENQLLRRVGYTVLFLILVFYTVAFLVIYLRRLIMLAFLTMIAPLVAMTYPIDKMNDGNAQAFNMWLKEYVYNLLIQPFHLILYTMLVGSALEFATENILYAVVAMGFLFQAEKLLRKFFGFDKAGTLDTNGSTLTGMIGMAGINALRRIGGGRKGGKSGSGSSSDSSKDSSKIRTADKGRSTRDLLNARQARQGIQPAQSTLNQGENNNDDDNFDLHLQDPALVAGGPETSSTPLDSSNTSRDWHLRGNDAFDSEGPRPETTDEKLDFLRQSMNMGRDPRYANNFNQPKQQGQQQPPQIRQHVDHNQQPLPNDITPDQPLPAPERASLWQRMKNVSEDDTRGLGRYLYDEWNDSKAKQNLLASEPAKLAKATGAKISDLRDKAGEGVRKHVPRPIRNTIRGAATVAGKAATYAIPRAGKLYAKGVLGATTGIVGVSAGLATGDDMNILKYGGAGAAAGWAAGTASENIARNASTGIQNVGENMASTYTTARGGRKAEKERQQAIEDRAAMRDKERQKKYMDKLKVPKSEMKQVMKDYQEYRKSGITDDDVIIGAMKAEGFGNGRANDERIILAGLANDVGKDQKKIKNLQERLTERGFKPEDVKKYIDGIREINDVY